MTTRVRRRNWQAKRIRLKEAAAAEADHLTALPKAEPTTDVLYDGAATAQMQRLANLHAALIRKSLRNHQIGPGRQNVVLLHNRIIANGIHNMRRQEQGKFEW